MAAYARVLVPVTLAFAALTAMALAEAGYVGIFEQHLRSWAGAQVLTDLAILALLACVWITLDARRSGLTAWPFVVVTVFGGSFGILFYLLARKWKGAVPAEA